MSVRRINPISYMTVLKSNSNVTGLFLPTLSFNDNIQLYYNLVTILRLFETNIGIFCYPYQVRLINQNTIHIYLIYFMNEFREEFLTDDDDSDDLVNDEEDDDDSDEKEKDVDVEDVDIAVETHINLFLHSSYTTSLLVRGLSIKRFRENVYFNMRARVFINRLFFQK